MAITQYGIRSATAQPMRTKISNKGKRKERQTQNVILPPPEKPSYEAHLNKHAFICLSIYNL